MKFMNLKRFASTVMAGVLALSMAVPALASNSTTINGTYRAITLNVVVPPTGSAIINPYGLPFELGEGVSISGQQITTGAPLVVQNKSAVPLSVSASIVGVKKGNFAFSATAVGAGETGNKGNVLFQMFEAPGVTEANAANMEELNPKFAALKDDDALCNTVLSETNPSATPAVPAVEEDNIVTLKAANASGELVDGGAAYFRLSGTVAKKPTTAWASTDGFTAKVTFTFEPTIETADAGTLALANTTLDSMITSSTTATLTPDLPSGVTVDAWSWSSSATSVATVTANDPATTANVARVSAGTATITVSGTGSDGKLYVATVDVTCGA